MKQVKLNTIIGMDQTGACKRGGQEAKSLPIVVALRQKKGWRFVTSSGKQRLNLNAFNQNELRSFCDQIGISPDWNTTAIVMDCVLGLPQSVLRSDSDCDIWSKIYQANRFVSKNGAYGRKPAEEFFNQLLPKTKKKVPKRVCEEWSQSNSVFQSRPFQKNIQTGTYRLWKEMGEMRKPWAKIWPYDLSQLPTIDKGPWLFEGYPSLIWQKYLNCSHREPLLLKRQAKKVLPDMEVDHWKNLENYPDHADAFVLAWGAAYLEKVDLLWIPFSGFLEKMETLQEGWILGLDRPMGI